MSVSENIRPEGEIIPPDLAIRALRDSGYRNTAYALAELIDNSVQAGASSIEVVCIQEPKLVKQRVRKRISAIGVLDNGSGMTPEVLRLALQFGNGTRLVDRSGIGRFGMGLPSSSISQCRKVDVWTWQSGPDNAMYTYLDVDEIENRRLFAVPMPEAQALPVEWRDRSNAIGSSGTLIVWSNFEEHRLSWRGAQATLRHTEKLIGRMYRKFIDSGKVEIRLLALENEEATFNRYARVNDPLYLMKDSSTPHPFDKAPMFQKWGKGDEIFAIEYKGKKHEVTVRMSWARPETVTEDKRDRGAQDYGKHAAQNLGVSILRAGRELDLDSGWTNSYDPVERWWGVEVEFPPTLDEIFGVTNNKQGTTVFSQMAQFDYKVEMESEESESEFFERIKSEGDPRAILMPIVQHIRHQITEVRKRLADQTKGRRKKNRYDTPTVEDLATSKFRERAEDGHETSSDREIFEEKDRNSFRESLEKDKNYPKDVAQEIADAVLNRQRKVTFLTKAMDGYAFFNVEYHQGGLTAIVFNTNHSFYDYLMKTLRPNIGDETDADLIERIQRAADTLELLFAAWARYEMEEMQRNKLFEMRQEWGKMARFFLNDLEK